MKKWLRTFSSLNDVTNTNICFAKKIKFCEFSGKLILTIFRLTTFEIRVQQAKICKKNLGVPVALNRPREPSGHPD